MATPLITEKELRIFALDKPELNTLIDGVKFSSESIEQAMINVVDAFNIIPPPTKHAYTIENFPSRYLLTIGVWGYLLRGAAIGEAQNNLTYSAVDVQINDRDKAQIFTELGNAYWQEFTELSKNYKLSQNISKCFGIHPSEYRWRSFI